MKRGGIRVYEGRVYARVRFGDGERLEERLPWATPRDEAAAEERAAAIAEIVAALVDAGRRDLVKSTARQAAAATTPARLETVRKAVAAIVRTRAKDESLTTFKDIAEDWISGELRKKYPDHVRAKASFKIERGRLRRYVYPHVKDVPIVAFERAHADLVMSKLPASRVKASATRRHVAQIMVRVCNLAVNPLGLIKASPLPRGYLPRIEQQRHYTCLFPREEAALMSCADVDEAFRLFVGVLNREGMRVSELADSEWWQWNLREGTFTATKTKTGDPRMWAIRPDVARAMRLWAERYAKTKTRPFADVVPDEKAKLWLATRLREGLAAAGVDRAELFDSTAYTGKLRAHDLRATFVTVSLAEGKADTWIRDRTGHKTLSMLTRYRRAARQFEELRLGPLVDLVDALGWGIRWVIPAKAVGADEDRSDGDRERFRRRDSNPDKRNQKPLGPSEGAREGAFSREIATDGDSSQHGIPQGSPTLLRAMTGLALERATWDAFDLLELEREP